MARNSKIESCSICKSQLERKGDDWKMLCPDCADAVSAFLDETGLNDQHVGFVVEFVNKMRSGARPGSRGCQSASTKSMPDKRVLSTRRLDQATKLLHRIADQMEIQLSRIYKSHVLDEFDTDDLRQAYGEWFGEDTLTCRYDRIERLMH